jgi:glycosyltransferase involved in cell wall biosynthesis
MKISVFLESFEPEFWGGRETRWNRLIPEIAKHHQIKIFADFSRVKPSIAFPNIDCTFVNIGPLPSMYGASGVRSLKHAFIYTWNSRKLLFTKADVILTDQTPLISIPILRLIAFLLRSELSVTWHEVWSLKTWCKYSKKSGLIGAILQTFALKLSKNIVVPSNQVLYDLENKFFSKKAIVIPNGIDVMSMRITKNDVSKKHQFVKLLYVGRLIKHKNCAFLLEIMTLSVTEGRDWHLTIVGDGPEASELNSSIKKLNLENWVAIESNVSRVELDYHYKSCDVFVFPSEREGFGISVSEALSNHVPAIVYDVPENAATSLIASGLFGRKISSLDPLKWVNEIQEILSINSNKEPGVFNSELPTWESVGNQFNSFLKGLKSDA